MNTKIVGITFFLAGFVGGWVVNRTFSTKEYSLKDSRVVKHVTVAKAIDGSPLLTLSKANGETVGVVTIDNKGIFIASNDGKIQQLQSLE